MLVALVCFRRTLLLRTVTLAMAGEDTIPRFGTVILILPSLHQPWLLIVSCLRHRVPDQREPFAIHPPSQSQSITDSHIQSILDHVDELERKLDPIEPVRVPGHAVREAHDIFDTPEYGEGLSKNKRRNFKLSTEVRLDQVEANVGRLERRRQTFN